MRNARAALAAALAALLAQNAAAQEPQAGKWGGQFSVYGWLPWIDADISARTPGGRTLDASLEATPSDILDSLKFAAFANGELRNGPIAIFGDLIYTDLDDSRTLSGPFSTDVNAEVSMLLVTLGASYQLWGDDSGAIDAAVGGRYVSADTDIETSRDGRRPVSRSASGDAAWVDPLVGLRARREITESLSLRGAADIGGFGVGSQFSWEVYAGATYAFSPRFAGEAGFRYLDIDYEGDGADADVDIQIYGPVIGLTVRF